jgi:hypothetical protein
MQRLSRYAALIAACLALPVPGSAQRTEERCGAECAREFNVCRGFAARRDCAAVECAAEQAAVERLCQLGATQACLVARVALLTCRNDCRLERGRGTRDCIREFGACLAGCQLQPTKPPTPTRTPIRTP